MLLDHFGWESMFYSIGFLAALWAYTVWKYFLKGAVTTLSQQFLFRLNHDSDIFNLYKEIMVALWRFIYTVACKVIVIVKI